MLAKSGIDILLTRQTQVSETRVTCLTPYPAINLGFDQKSGRATHASARVSFLAITKETTTRFSLWATFEPTLVAGILEYANDKKATYSTFDCCFYGDFSLRLSHIEGTRHHLTLLDDGDMSGVGIETSMLITHETVNLSGNQKFDANGRLSRSKETIAYPKVDLYGYTVPSLSTDGKYVVKQKGGQPIATPIDVKSYESTLYNAALANAANDGTYPNRVMEYYTEMCKYIPELTEPEMQKKFFSHMAEYMPNTKHSTPLSSTKAQFEKKPVPAPPIPTAPTVKAPTMKPPTIKK